MNVIKVLIIDDSHIIHIILGKIFSEHPDLHVTGNAYDGKEGVELTKKLAPDVIIMDIGMPLMDGLEAIQEIMSEYPTPIIVFSAANKNMMGLGFKAIEFGAVELIEKPFSEDIEDLKLIITSSLIRSIRVFADFKVVRRIRKRTITSLKEESTRLKNAALHLKNLHDSKQAPLEIRSLQPASAKKDFCVIGIAASTGGPQTIKRMLEDLTARTVNAAIVIVQHMAEGFMQGFCDWLAQYSTLPVIIPQAGEAVKTRMIYVAPGDYHLMFDQEGNFFLIDSPPVHGIRPCADIMLKSLADVFKKRVIAVILTGMGSDGTKGLFDVKKQGGYIIAQDEESSLIFGMPKSAIESGQVDSVLNLSDIPALIEKVTRERVIRGNERT